MVLKRLLQLKQNKPKTIKIVLFWVCFSASYMWNKIRKQNKSRRGLSVNQSINFAQQHCCFVNIRPTSYAVIAVDAPRL